MVHPRSMRRSSSVHFAWVLGFTLVGIGCAHRPEPRRAEPSRPAERDVVVLLVVDQLAAWVAEERLAELPANGGFARLLREGGGLRILEHGHAVTDTAPGHAALMTGRLPRDSGIAANESVEPDGRLVSILRDPETRTVGPSGVTERAASSLARLRVPTLADRLRERSPRARIVSLSLKDRAALFGGGRSPDAALYFDPALDAFVTSSAFASELPAWAMALSDSSSVSARHREPWELLDAAFVASHARVADDAGGEGDLGGFGTVFPHRFESASSPALAFRASPRSDEALVDLAIASLDGIGASREPLLLTVSLSANDYVGHIFGPNSWEIWDTLLRLDAQLARLFAALDARFGVDGWSALLSADHGVFAMPEEEPDPRCGRADAYERPCAGGVRIDPSALHTRLERAAEAALGPGPWLLGVVEPYVHFAPRGDAPEFRAQLVALVERELRAVAGIVEVIALPAEARCDRAPADDALCASLVAGFGDLLVVTAPAAFFDSGYVPGFGAGHGTRHAYDRRVPLLGRIGDPGHARGVRLPDAPGAQLRFDTYFALADRLLGGDGTP